MTLDQHQVLQLIQVEDHLRTPKYRQIVRCLINAIKRGIVEVGQPIPSINAISEEFLLSRDTVVKAYNELRERGVIASKHGKGFYVISTEVEKEYNVFLLFNKLSAHKKTIYEAIVQTLGKEAKVDLYVYHNDFMTFKNQIESNLGQYTHYIIISHFYGVNRPVSEVLEQIQKEKLVILDRKVKGLQEQYPAVYQNFTEDIFRALKEALPRLKDYDRLNMVFPASSYHPDDIRLGFVNFCEETGIPYQVLPAFQYQETSSKEAYIVLEDADLVALLKTAKAYKLTLGKDIGVISYNENPLKEFIAGGITVMSTDFQKMGETAAQMVLKGKVEEVENPFMLIWRESL